MYSSRFWGNLSRRLSFGSSVARASAASESIIKFTHNS
jgi:hypothetical protein